MNLALAGICLCLVAQLVCYVSIRWLRSRSQTVIKTRLPTSAELMVILGANPFNMPADRYWLRPSKVIFKDPTL